MMPPLPTDDGAGTAKEYECTIFGVAMRDQDKLRGRMQALCDDLSDKIECLDVEETLYGREGFEKGLVAAASNSQQQLIVRRIAGDVVRTAHHPRICTTGTVPFLTNMDENVRTELLYRFHTQRDHHNQRDRQKQHKASQAFTHRSMLRVQAAGQVLPFLSALGFRPKHTTSFRGERMLTRDGIEIELFRVNKEFQSKTFLVPSTCDDVASSPLLVALRAVCANEADVDKTGSKLRQLADDISVGSPFQEVPYDEFFKQK